MDSYNSFFYYFSCFDSYSVSLGLEIYGAFSKKEQEKIGTRGILLKAETEVKPQSARYPTGTDEAGKT